MRAQTVLDLGIAANPTGRPEQRVPCPHCAKHGHDDTLGVNIESGCFHCFRCGWAGKAHSVSAQPAVRIDDPAIIERKRERLRSTWRETIALTHVNASPVRAYLRARGLADIIKAPSAVLRAHRGLEYWNGARSLGCFPAMVALFQGAGGEPVTLHVTYLRSDGCAKAPVLRPKKLLGVPVRGATKGGAIQLYEPRNGKLGIAEGIESALSLHLIEHIPVWASFCADNLERVRLPAKLRELRIAVDIDPSGKGEAVATALAKRVMHWSPRTRVFYVKPELDGPGDLNDELRRRGA